MLVDYEKVLKGKMGVTYKRGTVVSILGSFAFIRFGTGGATIKAHVASGVSDIQRGDFVIVYYNPPETPVIVSNITKTNFVSSHTLNIINDKPSTRRTSFTVPGTQTVSDDVNASSADRVLYAPASAPTGEIAIFDEPTKGGRRVKGIGLRGENVLTNDGSTMGAISEMQQFVTGIIAGALRIFIDTLSQEAIMSSSHTISMSSAEDVHILSKGASVQAKTVFDAIGEEASSIRRSDVHGVFIYQENGLNYIMYRADEHVWEGNTRLSIAQGSSGLRNFREADIYLPDIYEVPLGATGSFSELVVTFDEEDIAWAELLVKPENMNKMSSIVYHSLVSFNKNSAVFRFEFRETKNEVTIDGEPPRLAVQVRLIREPTA